MNKTINTQKKSWETRKKKALVDSYKNATTAGRKRSIFCSFENQFGENIKKYLDISPTKKEKPTKVKKVPFEQKEVVWTIPYNVRKLVEQEVEKRFAELLKEKNLTKFFNK